MKTYSPLRYPGGKRKLINFFKELVNKNNLGEGVYAEPYAGGASIALSLLIDGYVSKVIINDYDKSIYAFWYSILNHTEEFCELIKKTPITIKEWKKQKEIQKNKNSEKDLLKLGFSTFFLNRTNFSGMIGAGPIGGFSQKGNWRINARFNKEELTKKIKLISEHKKNIRVYNMDALKLIDLLKNRSTKTLFYFDPPYFVKGKELYLNHYQEEDHRKVASKIFSIKGQKWVVTYDKVKPISNLYKKYESKTYSLRYSAGNSNLGKELIIASKNIILPKIN